MTPKRLPSLAPAPLEPHHLAELLDFRPDQGIIRLHEQRVVILSAAAMGLLRKELIDTLGVETARRLFLRFGYRGWLSRRREPARPVGAGRMVLTD